MPDRVAGKRGRRPSSIQHKFLSEFGVTLPAASYPIDVTGGYTAWQMLGNGPDPTLTGQYAQYAADGVGDCGDVTFQNERTISIALGKLPGTDLPTADGTLANYFAYTGGQDTGVDNSTFCPWLVKQGYCTGFARLTREERDQWMSSTGRGVLTGVTLTDSDMAEFENGQTWTCSGGQKPDPQEGHDILTVKAASSTGPHTCITWAAEQEYDESWDNACAEEWYALIVDEDKEWMGAEAYNAIIAYAQSVGGTTDGPDPTPGPTPGPAPAPTPTPPPDPVPTPPVPTPTLLAKIEALLRQLEALLRQLESEAWQDFCTQGAVHRHPALAVSSAREFRREVRRVLGMQP